MSAIRFSNFSVPKVQNYHSNPNPSLKISRISCFSGVPMQTIVRVGGVGVGLATAFAARHILGNVFSCLSLPFSIGDTIKVGSIEGQVVDIGLTYTSLLSPENFRVIVPNSLFSSEVTMNMSCAEYRAILTKIHLQTEDLSKICSISNDLEGMLTSNPKNFFGKDVPHCFLSQPQELTLAYNLKNMRKDEFYSALQYILIQAVRIIQSHGVDVESIQHKDIFLDA